MPPYNPAGDPQNQTFMPDPVPCSTAMPFPEQNCNIAPTRLRLPDPGPEEAARGLIELFRRTVAFSHLPGQEDALMEAVRHRIVSDLTAVYEMGYRKASEVWVNLEMQRRGYAPTATAMTAPIYGQGLEAATAGMQPLPPMPSCPTYIPTCTITNATTANYMGTYTVAGSNVMMGMTQPQEETSAQVVARVKAHNDQTIKAEKAKIRAREALESCMTEEQVAQLAAENCFDVPVNGKLYRIRPGNRVELLDTETKKPTALYCIHPESHYGLPKDDVALAQKLLLEADEEIFLRTANKTAVGHHDLAGDCEPQEPMEGRTYTLHGYDEID